MGDTFTIQLSSSLVNSLVDGAKKSKKKTKKSKSKTQGDTQHPQNNEHEKTGPDDSGAHKEEATTGWPHQPPYIMPETPPVQPVIPELEAIQSVLRESEGVVERLQKQEEHMVQEVTQRAKDLRDKEFKLPPEKHTPCLAEKDACMSCYKEHDKDPLKCANVVNLLAECARRVRQEVHK